MKDEELSPEIVYTIILIFCAACWFLFYLFIASFF